MPDKPYAMKFRYKLLLMALGLIGMAWIMNTDDKRIEYGERSKSLNNLVKDYEVGQEIISNQQAEQIEVLRIQVNQLKCQKKSLSR